MAKKTKKRVPETAEQMHADIRSIMHKRGVAASQSQYDKSVCISAVGAASATYERVPVTGTAAEYGQAVVAVLNELYNTYHDPEGEYTSGRAPIGDVYYDVSRIVDDLTPGDDT